MALSQKFNFNSNFFDFYSNFTCLAPPTKSWLFGNEELKPGGNVSIDKDDYKTKLVITKATRANAGNYTLK